MAANATWKPVGKPVNLGGCQNAQLKYHSEKGYGIALHDGENRGWVGLGDELDPAVVQDYLIERRNKARRELESCEEILMFADKLVDLVARVAKERAPATRIDAQAALAEAREILKRPDGTLPGAGEHAVLALAEALAARGVKQAVSA